LAARHVRQSQQQLLEHYPPDTPVAICYRVGWQDEQIIIVPLAKMAITTEANQFTRTTLYIISPALQELSQFKFRSRLYHPEHSHLFRHNTD
jgi:precorrin-4/cobalt-precorrin-4 C11-methyltransferase